MTYISIEGSVGRNIEDKFISGNEDSIFLRSFKTGSDMESDSLPGNKKAAANNKMTIAEEINGTKFFLRMLCATIKGCFSN